MPQSSPPIQWFPGHMAKTRRLMKENLPLVDVLVELRDARIPFSSSNPEIEKLAGQKPRVLLLAKSDLADPAATKRWCEAFERQGLPVLAVDCRSGKGLQAVPGLVAETLAALLARRAAKGMAGRPTRMMIVGVPNVGKSSFINRMAGGKPAQVADKPGVTRGKQWIKVRGGMELLDMPGVLWPKFEDPLVGENLAITGAIKDDIMDTESLAARLLLRLWENYPALLAARYKLAPGEGAERSGHELLALVGKKRGMLLPGGEIDTERAAIMALDELRGGIIGRISLESV